VHDLEHAFLPEHPRERGEVRQRQRIDAQGLGGGRDLHQTQLRAVGALAQELGVEADTREPGESCGERGKCRRCCD